MDGGGGDLHRRAPEGGWVRFVLGSSAALSGDEVARLGKEITTRVDALRRSIDRSLRSATPASRAIRLLCTIGSVSPTSHLRRVRLAAPPTHSCSFAVSSLSWLAHRTVGRRLEHRGLQHVTMISRGQWVLDTRMRDGKK